MNARRLAVAAGCLALAGCIPAYVNPTRDDAASLTYLPARGASALVTVFANGKECRNRSNVAGSAELRTKTEIKIPPGEEFTTLAQFSTGNWRCSIAASFTPKPREAYVAAFEGDGKKCKLGIVKVEGNKLVPEPTVRARKWSQPMWSDSQAQCE